jgi:pimeloyl-ACP methyl ester carboxylesterase
LRPSDSPTRKTSPSATARDSLQPHDEHSPTPEWTVYLKDRQPKTLNVWGRNDPLILPAAAEFVKKVVPAADLRYFDSGHFVLDENADAIAEAIIELNTACAGDQAETRVPAD